MRGATLSRLEVNFTSHTSSGIKMSFVSDIRKYDTDFCAIRSAAQNLDAKALGSYYSFGLCEEQVWRCDIDIGLLPCELFWLGCHRSSKLS
jgi:hypothetical protein